MDAKNKHPFVWVFGVLCMIGIGWVLFMPHTIAVSQAQIQGLIDDKVEEYGHLQGSYLHYDYDVVLSDVMIDIRDEGDIVTTGHIVGFVADRMIQADFSVDGKPVYRNRAFYFEPRYRETQITNFSFVKIEEEVTLAERGKAFWERLTHKEQSSQPLSSITEKAVGTMTKKVVDHVASITGLSQQEIQSLLKELVRSKLPVVTTYFFDHVPVVSLEDHGVKGLFLGAMLHRVTPVYGSVEIVFSLGMILVKALFGVVVIIAMVAVIIQFPGLLIGLSFLGS